nr:PAS domain S-box protein [bacterium]
PGQNADFFEKAPVGYFILTGRGRVSRCNSHGLELLGRVREEVRGKALASFLPKRDRGRWNAHLERVLSAGRGEPVEFQLDPLPGENSSRWIVFRTEKLEDGGKEVLCSTAADITERKLREDHLGRQRSLLESVMRTTDVMLVYLDLDFNFSWVNEAYARTCRLRPEEMVGKNHFALYPDKENEAIFRRVRDTGEGVFYKNKPFVFPDQPERGTTYWDWSLTPVKNSGGEVGGLVFSLRETTRYVRAQEKLRATVARLKLAQTSAGAGVWNWDIPTGTLEWSEELFRLFGLASSGTGADFATWRSVLHPDDRRRAEDRIRRAIARRTPLSSQYRIVLPSGEVRWINALGDTVFDASGKPVRMSGICIDVTAAKRAENALRESEERYRKVVERANDGILIVRGATVAFANRKLARMSGYSVSELIGTPFSRYVQPREREKILKRYRRRMAGKRVKSIYETVLRRKDGSLLHAEINAGRIKIEGEDADLVFVRDIGLRKRAEAAAGEEEKRLKGILDSMADLVYITNAQYEIEYVNPAMKRAFGAARNRKCYAYLYGRKRPCPWCRFSRVLKGKHLRRKWETAEKGRAYDVLETPIRHADGNVSKLKIMRDITSEKRMRQEVETLSRFPSENPNPVIRADETGKIIYVNAAGRRQLQNCVIGGRLPPDLSRSVRTALRTGKIRNLERSEDRNRTFLYSIAPVKAKGYANLYGMEISKLKHLEEQYREINARLEELVGRRTEELRGATDLLERIFANTHFLLAYLDPGFNFIRVNDAYARAEGRSRKFFAGENYFHLHPHKETETVFRRVKKTGKPHIAYDREFFLPGGTGERPTYWDWSLHPVKNQRGKTEGFVLALVDVTERRKTELELERLQTEMAESKRLSSIGTLAATVAHELRTPLGTIGLAAANLEKKNRAPELAGHIEKIERKVRESNQIISNLLTFTRIKYPRYRTVRLDRILQEAAKTARERYPLKKTHWALKLENLEKRPIEADYVQILEVFSNIIINACQAVADRTGRIGVEGRIDESRQAVVTVTDNGVGMDEHELPRVFEPFYSGKKTGTGLGLALSKELTELHGGSIEISSEKGKGTAVTVVLPQKRGA